MRQEHVINLKILFAGAGLMLARSAAYTINDKSLKDPMRFLRPLP